MKDKLPKPVYMDSSGDGGFAFIIFKPMGILDE
jgi:hypothetical protein